METLWTGSKIMPNDDIVKVDTVIAEQVLQYGPYHWEITMAITFPMLNYAGPTIRWTYTKQDPKCWKITYPLKQVIVRLASNR